MLPIITKPPLSANNGFVGEECLQRLGCGISDYNSWRHKGMSEFFGKERFFTMALNGVGNDGSREIPPSNGSGGDGSGSGRGNISRKVAREHGTNGRQVPYLGSLNKCSDPLLQQALELACVYQYEKAFRLISNTRSTEATFVRAILLLHLNKRNEALGLFQQVKNSPDGNFLAPAFCDYITKTEEEAGRMYGVRKFSDYFRAVSKSPAFRGIYTAVNNTIRSMHSSSTELCFVDIGIGTAEQSVKLIEMMEANPNAVRLKIIAIEPYESMRRTAQQVLDNHIGRTRIQVEYKCINKFAQEITKEDILSASGGQRVDIVNASTSIHHMTRDEKKGLLRVIRELNPQLFIISDADSDHESTLDDMSLELISNVFSFYESLYGYMLTKANFDNAEECCRGFCYYDARNIILNQSGSRIEYHTTAPNWRQYLRESGFTIMAPRQEWLNGIDPKYCLLHDDYMYTAYYNRPIFFQLTATVAASVD